MDKKLLETIGSVAFIFGVVISIVAGVIALTATVLSVLMILGLLVGFLNIAKEETQHFLVGAVSLVIVLSLGGVTFETITAIGNVLQPIINAVLSFIIPATVVVALRSLFGIARN